ncbi:MAG: ExbD/TolR family protein [Thermaurantiacus sp.]
MGATLPGAGGGRGRRRRAPMSEINVTPFVDVMLVLLIIFMVAAPLLVTGVAVDLPRTSADALPQDREPVSITMDADGRTFIGDDQVPAGMLPARLQTLRTSLGDDVRIVIRADAALSYGQVAGLLADVTSAGFTQVALVNQPGRVPAPDSA